jgi:hypothetical protein
VFGLVLGVGSLIGALPIWTIVPALALPAATWGAGRVALRRRPGMRVVCLATAASLSTWAWSRLLGWVVTAALARLVLVVAVLEALAAPHLLEGAVIALCGLALGGALPFAPGGAGVAAATMSVALGHAGLPAPTAVAAAVSFHAFETAAGLLFGTSGWLLLRLSERAGSRAGMRVESELPVTASA